MAEKTIVQLAEETIDVITKLKDKLRVNNTSKMLLDGDLYTLREKNKELAESLNILQTNYDNKVIELESKHNSLESQYKARVATLNAEVAELTLRKNNLIADIEVLNMNKLRMIESVNEIKAERSMKKAANV